MTKKLENHDRKLSIIFAADIYGYSALMRENELRTLNLLKRTRKITDLLIEQHRGRIANTAGDSIIAVFENASGAIQCAIAIQNKLQKANAKISKEKKMLFRIGLNIGEIFANGNDILGDGVNIAARIESQAEQGAITMSEGFYKLIWEEIRAFPTAKLNNIKLKNINTPVTIYEILSNRAIVENQKKQFGIKYRLKVALLVVFSSFAVSTIVAIMVIKNLEKIGL